MQENEKPIMNLEIGGNQVEDANIVEDTTPKKPEFITYKKGDLILTCSCGNEEILEKAIEGGIRIMLPTTDTHKLMLSCSKCKSSIGLYYKESIEEENESISEDDKTE